MGDVDIPMAESIDAPAQHVGPDFAWWDRSAARTPMPWTGGPAAGFTTGRPWLRLGHDVDVRNVESQSADPDSVLACYRRVLHARRSCRPIQDGSLRLCRTDRDDIIAFRRLDDTDEALVLIGFSGEAMTTRTPRALRGGAWRPLVGTHLAPAEIDPTTRLVSLRPFEAVVYIASRE
jgi:glycosidase